MASLHFAIKKNQKAAILFAINFNKSKSDNYSKFDFNLRWGKFGWTGLHYAVVYSDY